MTSGMFWKTFGRKNKLTPELSQPNNMHLSFKIILTLPFLFSYFCRFRGRAVRTGTANA
jgi:hypothetical protein